MMDTMTFGKRRNKKPVLGTTALWLILGLSATASATPSTLQDLFDGQSFTQDGLTFSAFDPVLGNPLPSGAELLDIISTNPADLLNVPFLDLGGGGQFSQGWHTAAANAAKIGLTILPDNGATPGVDPGFELDGASEWTVNAVGDAAAQLSAFAYTVTSPAPNMNSAEILQTSTIDAIGPDCGPTDPKIFTCFPFGDRIPDVAGGFALQFILEPNSADLLNAILNISYEGGVQTLLGEIQASEVYGWSGFTGRDEIRVVSVVGVGASSEGGFTMNSLEQRIDPPPGGAIAMPLPGTLLLFGLGLTGLAIRLRRR
jgi:hypothetical protein